MRALVFQAEWAPRDDYSPTERERITRKVHVASRIWRSPQLTVQSVPDPTVGPDDVLIRVRAAAV